MTRSEDSSLIAMAITSISGQSRIRAVADRTTSMILFRNGPNEVPHSARRSLSPFFEPHSTIGSRSAVEPERVKILLSNATEDAFATKCLGLKFLDKAWNAAGPAGRPEEWLFAARVSASMRTHHSHFSERRNRARSP